MRKTILWILLFSNVAFAGEETIRLKSSIGREKVTANCVMCHSLDYITMNSGFLDQKGWEAVVNKMIKVMGAPIQEKDAPEIVHYLFKNYGK